MALFYGTCCGQFKHNAVTTTGKRTSVVTDSVGNVCKVDYITFVTRQHAPYFIHSLNLTSMRINILAIRTFH